MAITFNITQEGEDDENIQRSLLSTMNSAKNDEGKPVFTTASTIALKVVRNDVPGHARQGQAAARVRWRRAADR